MPRPRRHVTTVTTVTSRPSPAQPAGVLPGDGVERLRGLVKARREAPRPSLRPGFRERLSAWLEEEL